MHHSSAPPAIEQYRSAVAGFLELLESVRDGDWPRTALGEWTVRDLVGHTSRALLTVESYLDPGRTTNRPDLPDAASYFRAAAAALADPAAVAERGRQAGAALGNAPVAAVTAIAERVLAGLEGSADDALVTTPVGTMTLAGYLPSRIFELVVHSLDLAAAIDRPPPARLPLRPCLELAAALAADHEDAAEVLLALTGRHPLRTGFSVL